MCAHVQPSTWGCFGQPQPRRHERGKPARQDNHNLWDDSWKKPARNWWTQLSCSMANKLWNNLPSTSTVVVIIRDCVGHRSKEFQPPSSPLRCLAEEVGSECLRLALWWDPEDNGQGFDCRRRPNRMTHCSVWKMCPDYRQGLLRVIGDWKLYSLCFIMSHLDHFAEISRNGVISLRLEGASDSIITIWHQNKVKTNFSWKKNLS